MKASNRILVTGATGLVGANLLRKLVDMKVTLRATIHNMGPAIRDDRIEYAKADLTNADACKRVVKGVDMVFMCAAVTSGAAVIASNPLAHVTPNIVMNSHMLEASYREGVRKFVWISSSVGYPPSADRPVNEDEFFEGNPPDVYFASGWMKRYTEILSRMYSEKMKRRMPVVVLRPSNIYGPYDKFDLKTSHVTAALIRKVVERQDPIVVWGSGKDVRDVIFVDDFVNAMILAAEKIDTFSPINIAKGETYSVDDILRAALQVDGYADAHIVHDLSKPSMIPIRRFSTQKAEKILRFRACTTLEDGLRTTIKWYRAHEDERRNSSKGAFGPP